VQGKWANWLQEAYMAGAFFEIWSFDWAVRFSAGCCETGFPEVS